MSYRDNKEALEEKVTELTRELEAAQERHRTDAAMLAELRANVQAVTAAVRHESPGAVQPARAQPKSAAPFVALGVAGVLVLTGATAAMFIVRRPPPPVPMPMPPAVTKVDEPATVAPALPDDPLNRGLIALAQDGPGYVIAVSATTLMKLDAKTLTPVWNANIADNLSWGESDAYAINTGTRLAFITMKGAFFYDDAVGSLSTKFLWKSPVPLRGVCAPGGDQVLVASPFDGVIRLNAVTGQKAEMGETCKTDVTTPRCDAENTCGYSTYRTKDLSCGSFLRVGKDEYMACELDDGTGGRAMVAVGADKKERWRTVRVGEVTTPDYLDVVADSLIVATSKSIEGYDVKTGSRRWVHPRDGQGTAILGGNTHVIFGGEGTVIAVEAISGRETARMKGAKK